MRFEDIADGLSNTILIGEKQVPIGQFGVGWLDSSQYNGDSCISAGRPAGPDSPLATGLTQTDWTFGSYHPGLCLFGFGDGSVRRVPVSIDPKVLGWLANRSDGQVLPDF